MLTNLMLPVRALYQCPTQCLVNYKTNKVEVLKADWEAKLHTLATADAQKAEIYKYLYA